MKYDVGCKNVLYYYNMGRYTCDVKYKVILL